VNATSRPRLLVLGSRGQVGFELVRSFEPIGEVVAPDRSALDVADAGALREAVRRARPDFIVNAAAYTQVDRAESEPRVAHQVNAIAPAILAEEAKRSNALLIHFSTDYVFDGSASERYGETDVPRPASVYGATKLAGDTAVLESGVSAYVFRVGWVFGLRGRNFLRTIRQLALEKDELRIVADQHGSPTWSREIARVTTRAVQHWLAFRNDRAPAPEAGLYHVSAPDYTTWFGFATAIVCRTPPGLRRPVVTAITTAEYPTPAVRPAWSVLDSGKLRAAFGLSLPSWSDQLTSCLSDEERDTP
jgi:dTDP-4-dehydrorhamnose reductase